MDICPRYSDIDTYHMAACAIDEAVRNAIAVGGEPGADGRTGQLLLVRPGSAPKTLTENTSWPNSSGPWPCMITHWLMAVPCISGKDSMKNDYHMGGDVKISIPPTILVLDHRKNQGRTEGNHHGREAPG